MKSTEFSEQLEDLLIQKVCEMGNLSYILRRKNHEIEKMDAELLVLKKVLNKENNSSERQNFIVENLNGEEKILMDIFRIYWRLLGRDPDIKILRTYTNNVLAGKTIDWVKEQIKLTEEYKRYNKI